MASQACDGRGAVPMRDTVTVNSEHDGTACNVDVVHLLVYNPIAS